MRAEIERLIKQAERHLVNARKTIGIDAFEVAARRRSTRRSNCSKAERPDETIERFRRELLPTLIEECEPQRVLVFGSRARGDALKHSDLDVLVVSEVFRDVPWLERCRVPV